MKMGLTDEELNEGFKFAEVHQWPDTPSTCAAVHTVSSQQLGKKFQGTHELRSLAKTQKYNYQVK